MPDITDSGTHSTTAGFTRDEALADASELSSLAGATIMNAQADASMIASKMTTMTVGGNAELHPITTVTGPCTTLQLQNHTTGKTFTWGVALAENETLVIDHYKRTATIDDVKAPLTGATGELFTLVPGVNFVSAGAGTLGASFSVFFSYRDAYL